MLHERYVFSKFLVFVYLFKGQIFDKCYEKTNVGNDTIMFKVNPETYRTYKKQHVERSTIIEQSFTKMQRKDHNRYRYLFSDAKNCIFWILVKIPWSERRGYIFTEYQYSQSISWPMVNNCVYKYHGAQQHHIFVQPQFPTQIIKQTHQNQ